MTAYIDLLKKIAQFGNVRADRTGTGTVSIFGPQISHDMRLGFPLPTERKTFLKGAIEEIIWMLAGSTDNNKLRERGVTIWDEWAITQEDLEYTGKERLKLLMNSLIKQHGEKEAQEKYCELFRDGMAEDEFQKLMKSFHIPKLRPNPYCIKPGALGPIYGDQWCNWPDPASNETRQFSTAERIHMAENLLQAGLASAYNEQQLLHLRKSVDLCKGESRQVVQNAHQTLTSWGIPVEETELAFVNQIDAVIEGLKKKPFSRRHVVSTWNVPYLPDETKSPKQNVMDGRMSLAPCHVLFQFYVEDRQIGDMYTELQGADVEAFATFAASLNAMDLITPVRDPATMRDPKYWEAQFAPSNKKAQLITWLAGKGIKTRALSLKLYQRSADAVLGVPFNMAGYCALLMMVAQCVDMVPDYFIHSFGDAHIYKNHLLPNEAGESVFTIFDRESRPYPKLTITDPTIKNIFDFKYEHFKLEGYDPHPAIKFEVSI
jgi:thymidylate synthase